MKAKNKPELPRNPNERISKPDDKMLLERQLDFKSIILNLQIWNNGPEWWYVLNGKYPDPCGFFRLDRPIYTVDVIKQRDNYNTFEMLNVVEEILLCDVIKRLEASVHTWRHKTSPDVTAYIDILKDAQLKFEIKNKETAEKCAKLEVALSDQSANDIIKPDPAKSEPTVTDQPKTKPSVIDTNQSDIIKTKTTALKPKKSEIPEALPKGTRVQLNDNKIKGTIDRVSQEYIPKHHEYYSYYVNWDNGKLGIPNNTAFTVINDPEEQSNLTVPDDTKKSEILKTDQPVFTGKIPGSIHLEISVLATSKKPESYPGNKGVLHVKQKILNQVPAHTNYYECFAGHAHIAQALPVSKNKIVNDLSPTVVTWLNKNYTGGGEITNLDAIPMLRSLKAKDKSNFIFLDPPYLLQARLNSLDLYEKEMTDRDHIEMLTAVLQLRCNVLIIHPVCDLYENMLKDWRKVEVKIKYHSKTSIEGLYMNYPVPEKLQTYEHLGADCWDRQRIKRKGDRLLSKMEALAPQEREYLLNKIFKKYKV